MNAEQIRVEYFNLEISGSSVSVQMISYGMPKLKTQIWLDKPVHHKKKNFYQKNHL